MSQSDDTTNDQGDNQNEKKTGPDEGAEKTKATQASVSQAGEGAEVVSIDRARLQKEEKAAAATPMAASALGDILAPVMANLAKELAGFAGSDGVVRLGDGEEARKKTAVLVKGLGEGLSAAINQAFTKWAVKIEVGESGGLNIQAGTKPTITVSQAPAATKETPAGDGKDDKPKG